MNAHVITADQLDAVLALEQTLYPHPWSRANFADALLVGDYTQQLTHPQTQELVGYLVAKPGVEEVHLLNLAVHPDHQRQGWAQRMLQDLAQWAKGQSAQCIWLEVRTSNTAALALYLRVGFKPVNVRRNYYPGPAGTREDAQVMRQALSG